MCGGDRPPRPSKSGAGTLPPGCVVEPCAAENGPFANRDEAARAAMAAANPDSIRDNREYSGLIYRDSSGQYYYSGPAMGTDQGANPWADAPIPAGCQEIGYYHTHGDYSTMDAATGAAVRTSDPMRDDFNSDNFSGRDKAAALSHGTGNPDYRGYVATPGGSFRSYDPATGTDVVL